MRSAKKLLSFVTVFSLFLSTNSSICLAASKPNATAPLTIAELAFALPEAQVGVEYEYLFQSEGGLAPLKWRIAQGKLPVGLKLETSGKLHGIPSQAQREAYAFLIEVSDSSNTPQRFTQPFLLIARAAPLRITLNQPGLRIVPPQVAQPTGAQGRNTGRGTRNQNSARPNSGAIPVNPLGGDELRADVSGVAENSIAERADGNVSAQNGLTREIEAPAIQKPLYAGDVEIQGTASATDTVQLSLIDVDGVKKISVPVADGKFQYKLGKPLAVADQVTVTHTINGLNISSQPITVSVKPFAIRKAPPLPANVLQAVKGANTLRVKTTKGVMLSVLVNGERVQLIDSSKPENDPARKMPSLPVTSSDGVFDVPLAQPLGAGSLAIVIEDDEKNIVTSQPIKVAEISKPKVCGQIRPASLDQTLAVVRALDLDEPAPGEQGERGKLIARYYPARQNAGTAVAPTPTATPNYLTRSNLTETCDRDPQVLPGLQRLATIDFLKATLKSLKEREERAKARTMREDEKRNPYPSLSRETIEKQILFLESYVGNVEVHLVNGDNVKRVYSDKDGNYEAEVDKDTEYTVSTEADEHFTKRQFKVAEGQKLRVNLSIEDRPVSLLTRAVVGFQQAGAAAQKSEQNYFFDFFISNTFPIQQKIDPDFGERSRLWGSVRAISVPQNKDVTIAGLSSTLAADIAGLKVQDAARVFDIQAGFEIFLKGNNALLPSFDRDTKQKFSFSLIGSFGFVTPTTPQESVSTFEISEELKAQFKTAGIPIPEGKTTVAFVAKDRDRFFRQYYFGIRTQTFFFNRHNIPLQRFPAQFDVTIGQNEYVTGGKFDGPVVRLDGFFPLPYDKLKYINLFGTAVLKPTRVKQSDPLILKPVEATVPGTNVLIVPVSQFNRDYYKIGVGIDFLSLVQAIRNANKPNTKTAGTP